MTTEHKRRQLQQDYYDAQTRHINIMLEHRDGPESKLSAEHMQSAFLRLRNFENTNVR